MKNFALNVLAGLERSFRMPHLVGWNHIWRASTSRRYFIARVSLLQTISSDLQKLRYDRAHLFRASVFCVSWMDHFLHVKFSMMITIFSFFSCSYELVYSFEYAKLYPESTILSFICAITKLFSCFLKTFCTILGSIYSYKCLSWIAAKSNYFKLKNQKTR